MSKKVLFIHYSQSGQLTDIVEAFKVPFTMSDHTIENVIVNMENKFFFPWTTDRFFDAMPESVLGIALPLEDLSFQEVKYDLIVFAYQPWFLSPSIPANSILSNPEFRKRLKDTPVLTIIGARNMWLNAQEKVKKVFEACGSLHVGNIALTDTNNNLVSAITILHWMLSGRKDRFLGFFPLPGISMENISGMSRFGDLVLNELQSGDWQGLQKKLVDAGAVKVKSNLMFIEARAGKLFSIWANLIIKKKNRRLWVNLYKYYLLVALFLIAPIVLTVYMLIFKPFLGASIRKKKKHFLGLN
ncbi:MAG TPA: hypothetical protein PKJ62_06020 [Bacteroidia bacterium]|nr:hypothetical protein [Bacteroidia bacterium]HNS11676.1 hypothetical protein [Bacteroidia bacterium]